MSNVLNPETESITLNTELETPIFEPATELEQPSFESTSNPETAEIPEAIAPSALDADATTEPVAALAPLEEAPVTPQLVQGETVEIPVQVEPAATVEPTPVAEEVAAAAPEIEPPAAAESAEVAVPAVSAPPVAAPHRHGAHPEHGAESMEDFSAALEAFEREQAAEAAAVEAYGDKVVSGTVLKLTDKHLVIDVGLKSEGDRKSVV